MKHRGRPLPWQPLACEFAGTALLMLVGLSVVIFMFGTGSPAEAFLPDAGLRRLITGFLFGATGASIAVSPLGRISGAHVNPAVTWAFWMMGKFRGRAALGYVVAQLGGAIAGCLPLLFWGAIGRSVAFGATLPGAGYPAWFVLLGEAVTTFALIAGLSVFLGFRKLRPFTPALFPFLYAAMVYLEAPVSGTSTNPARSLGPAVVSGDWNGAWIYWVGPAAGTLAAVIACRYLAKRISVAKLYHFESDVHRLFHRIEPRGVATTSGW